MIIEGLKRMAKVAKDYNILLEFSIDKGKAYLHTPDSIVAVQLSGMSISWDDIREYADELEKRIRNPPEPPALRLKSTGHTREDFG